jgi:uncharacterized membrane protein YccC
MASLLVARLLKLPEACWAPITTLIVMQSTLRAALTISGQRFAGTALGAAVGALVAIFLSANVLVFGAAVFVVGIVCAFLRLEAYRFASIALAIILLIQHSQPARVIAFHRFVEVSVGIVVALALTAAWPESRHVPPRAD